MRRILILLAVVVLFAEVTPLPAQDAVARARQQELEDQVQRANARVQALEEALQAIQQEMNALRGELRNQRQEGARGTPVSQNALAQIEDKIREIDRKRMADNEKIMAELLKLQRRASAQRPTPNTTPPPAGKTYEYTVREGDSLYKIVADLREQGLNLKQDAVMKANPKVDWNRLRIGSTIVIPVPE